MSQDLTLHQRRRAPTPAELKDIPWLGLLNLPERAETLPQLVVGDALVGDVVCRIGRAPTYWFGV
ncbi:MAG: Crp/Fnr family transcriptional regulator, partial [Burkholderiales bacterium]